MGTMANRPFEDWKPLNGYYDKRALLGLETPKWVLLTAKALMKCRISSGSAKTKSIIRERNTVFLWKFKPQYYTMNRPNFTVGSSMGNSIGPKRVKKLTDNQDSHKISDKLEFGQDQTSYN